MKANPNFDADAFLKAHAAQLGALDGLPALDRVKANRYHAADLLINARNEIKQLLQDNALGYTNVSSIKNQIDVLKNEIDYLKRVESGDVQLYLFDPDNSRIIEMIGTPGPDTKRVVTYSPGTFANLNGFYTGGAQQVSSYLNQILPGTVAFVYKDGHFPGEDDNSTGGLSAGGILEANDEDAARKSGQQLASFEQGMRTDPLLGGAKQVGIGHSWGLANVTSSEVAGTHYNTVLSLSGAGMLPDWKPEQGTNYVDLSYHDILQQAQDLGVVWDNNNPRHNPAFDSLPYFRGPDDGVLNIPSSLGPAVTTVKEKILLDNHNLIATNSQDNKGALKKMRDLAQ